MHILETSQKKILGKTTESFMVLIQPTD